MGQSKNRAVFPDGGRLSAAVLCAGAMLIAIGGCRSVRILERPAFDDTRTAAPSGALVFDSQTVRADRLPRDGGIDALHSDYARNDDAVGVRSRTAIMNDRLYRSSDWYGPREQTPNTIDHHRGHTHHRFGDRTVPLLSPTRERSYGWPY